jgi:hypothetical protein
MFCPGCGSEERQATQYCRACGVDLRAVRLSVERPDSITASAVSARDEIGRAVADRIRSVGDAVELKIVADSVLPQVEAFLASPEEKRLRRIRAGVIVGAIGLGAGFLGLIWSSVANAGDVEGAVIVGGLGIVAFALGLGFVLNGVLFTKLRGSSVTDQPSDAKRQDLLDSVYTPPHVRSTETPVLRSPTTSNLAAEKGTSVTEHTTLNLKKD